MFLGSPQKADIWGIEFFGVFLGFLFVFFLGWGGGVGVLLPELYCMYFSFEV